MVSTTINFSGLLCLFLALGPATILASPQAPGFPVPDIMSHSESTNEDGNSDFMAGSGINAGIPDGPSFNAGAGVHTSHRGPCGPNSGDDFDAGSGINAGIPDGPSFNAGAGVHDHRGGEPCPEPEPSIVFLPPSPTATVQPPTYAPVPAIVPTPAPAVPTYTTPIYIPHTTPAVYAPAVPIVKPSTALIPHPAPAPSASPSSSPMPVFNAGSSLAPASVLAVAIPAVLAFFN
ncbi:unnamed protein product [Penicillium olsonii]|nr:unnamed protein product [Penicillium olsonii]CAG7926908.1 unnamed protein product [Penicillium olsonii]